MKNFILTSLIVTGLSFSTMTVQAEETPKRVEAQKAEEATKQEEAKKEETKTHTRHKMTKEERLAHKLKEAEDLMASLTEKVKTLSGIEKEDTDLAIEQAKGELDLAKKHLKEHGMRHINNAKRILKKVHSKEHKK